MWYERSLFFSKHYFKLLCFYQRIIEIISEQKITKMWVWKMSRAPLMTVIAADIKMTLANINHILPQWCLCGIQEKWKMMIINIIISNSSSQKVAIARWTIKSRQPSNSLVPIALLSSFITLPNHKRFWATQSKTIMLSGNWTTMGCKGGHIWGTLRAVEKMRWKNIAYQFQNQCKCAVFVQNTLWHSQYWVWNGFP